MLKASSQQKKIIAILTKGDKELKKALVQQTTGGEWSSTNDLSHVQANQLIQYLGGKPVAYDNWALFDKDKASHRQVLSLCITYGWTAQHPTRGEIANLGRLSEWLKSPRCPVNKKLKDMSPTEVSKIISALEGMVQYKFQVR